MQTKKFLQASLPGMMEFEKDATWYAVDFNDNHILIGNCNREEMLLTLKGLETMVWCELDDRIYIFTDKNIIVDGEPVSLEELPVSRYVIHPVTNLLHL